MNISSHRETLRQSFLKESDYFRVSSPLFSALTRASADDEDILQLCSATRPGQSAVLLPFVVHYLLLKDPEPKAALAQYFPHMTEQTGPLAEAFPVFREFCLDRRADVTELLEWRTVNTNLVEKSSCLLPAMQYVSRQSREPLTLLEICCSAGINLLFDQYHYDYGSNGTAGPVDSAVQLSCKMVGTGRPPVGSIPVVAQRMGVDLVEIDISDPLERLWMQAVLCPEWQVERKRLAAALSIRTQHDLQVIEGDALEVIPPLLESLPGSLCILQSYCMGHWSDSAKAALEAVLLNASQRRDIHRVGIEMPENESPAVARDRLMKLAAAGIPILHKQFPSRIEYTRYRGGHANNQLLAQGDGFGLWLDWQANSD